MPIDFYSVFYELQAMGVYDFVLPFLLVFALVFSILEKLKILGEDKTNINLAVSLIIGLILVAQPEITYIINSFIPKVSLFILVVLMFLVVAGMFGASTGDWSSYALLVAFIVSVLAIIWALYPGSATMFPHWFRPDPQEKAWIILIVTVVLVIAFIKGKGKEDTALDKFIEGLSKPRSR